jgi:metal-sulfur cluster biosynthetic enzyme
MPTVQDIREKLKEVLDPELGVSIVDMGLIYDVALKDGVVTITMTLTTIGCPLFETINKNIEDALLEMDGVEDINIQLTFDPPWDSSKMSESARAQLGFD